MFVCRALGTRHLVLRLEYFVLRLLFTVSVAVSTLLSIWSYTQLLAAHISQHKDKTGQFF